MTFFTFVLLFVTMLRDLGTSPTPSRRLVEIVAGHDYTFLVKGPDPSELVVKPGEPLKLRISAQKAQNIAHDGAVHSFVVKQLRDQGWDIRLHEGTNDYDVTAPTERGEYLIECTVRCGPGHDHMHMKLVVQ